MAFQINEKMMAQDRAIITRNKKEQDLLSSDLIKFKPGMLHYVAENQKLWLSVEPTIKDGMKKSRAFVEILHRESLEDILHEYLHIDGGPNSAMRGSLHSIVNNGTAPFVIKSKTRVSNLNADMVDGKHVNDATTTEANLWTAKKIDNEKAPRGFGLGTDINVIPGNDCNLVVGTGFYSGTDPINGVAGETGKALLQSYIGNDAMYQTLEYISSKNKYSRIKDGDVWSDWDKGTTGSNILNEGADIVIQTDQPTNIDKDNTYWYEIVQQHSSEGPKMYYGFIPYEVTGRIGSYQEITKSMLTDSRSKIVSASPSNLDKESIGIVPEGGLIIVALPDSCNMTASRDNGIGGKAKFKATRGVPNANGTEVMLDGIPYKLYGEMLLIDGEIFIHID